MNQEFYQIKDIFFGLRQEYFKIQEEINKLRKIILENDKRIIEYETTFAITQKSELPALISKLKVKQSKLEKTLSNLENRLKSTKLSRGEFEFVIDEQNLYRSLEKIKLGKRKNKTREEYIQIISAILSSQFATEFRDVKITDEKDTLHIGTTGIRFYKHSDFHDSRISYSKEKDEISVSRNSPGAITDEFMYRLFKIPVLKSSFSEYMQECIEHSIEEDKKIELPRFRTYGREDFKIIEEEKRIILCNELQKKKQKTIKK